MNAAGRVALDNYANNSNTGQQRADLARLERWRARAALWEISGISRVRKCGRVTVSPDGMVGVRKSGEKVGFSGLATCGSVWACPVCNSRIQAVRRLEVGAAIAQGAASGSMAFGALTLRHHRGQSLSTLWGSLSYCWNAMMAQRGVRRLLEAMGYYGYIRATECTYGFYGWHPHIHPIFFFDREVTTKQLDELFSLMFAAWARAAGRRGLSSPLRDAQDFRIVTDPEQVLGDYMAKSVFEPQTVAYEMTSSQTKRARGGRTPWQILDDLRHDGDADDLDLWLHWEAATKGKRALIWSRGLKKRFGIGEIEDEEIAAAEVGDVEDEGFKVADWSVICRDVRLGPMLLAAVRRGGFAAGRRFCIEHEIPFVEVAA